MRGLVVAVACLVVLAGAWLVSRSLTSDEAVAPPVSVPSPSNGTVGKPLVPMPAGMERRRDAFVRPPPPPAGEAAAPPVEQPVAPKQEEEAKAVPPAEPAESPFVGASRELAYVEEILRDRESDETKLKSAWDVLNRCLEQEPGNARCQADLDTAKRRMSALGIEATERGGAMNPKLLGDQQQQIRPIKQ